jgi:hypothetical protein
MKLNIQYWCIDGKYRIYVAILSIHFMPSQYCIYPALKFAKKNVFNLFKKWETPLKPQ